MLLLDLSSIVIGRVISYYTREKEDVSERVVRHLTLSAILQYRKKYKQYGEVVICADARDYWRKDVYPLYKANRKISKDSSRLDFERFYFFFDIVKKEIRETFGYTYLEVDRCEADDVIYILAGRHASAGKMMIVSSDKDLIQIQSKFGEHIKQFSPSIKKLLTAKQNDYNLIEHIIRGDSSDGIPNIISDDDVFICEDKRQKPIYAAMIKDAMQLKNPEYIAPNADALARYKRNQILIDMDYIPSVQWKDIVAQYKERTGNKAKNIMKYLMKHRMKNFAKELGNF